MAKSLAKGEGSYSGARDYNARTECFVEKNRDRIDKLANAAKDAVSGKDRDELEAAEVQGKPHAMH